MKLLQLAVLALVLTCTPYFFKYVLERSTTDISLYLGVFSVAGLLSVPFWRWVIGRYGKRDTYMLSIVLYGAGMASWFVWQAGEPEFWFYARATVLGVLSNGTLLCALSLLPDTMEYDKLKSGESREGIMSGAFTTIEKNRWRPRAVDHRRAFCRRWDLNPAERRQPSRHRQSLPSNREYHYCLRCFASPPFRH